MYHLKKDKKPLDRVVVIKEVHDFNLAGSCEEKVAENVKIIEKETKYTSNNSEKKTVETSEETRLLPKRKIAAEICKKNFGSRPAKAPA